MTKCPACLARNAPGDYEALSHHLVERAEASDAAHVRWLNQNITRQKSTPAELNRSRRTLSRASAGFQRSIPRQSEVFSTDDGARRGRHPNVAPRIFGGG